MQPQQSLLKYSITLGVSLLYTMVPNYDVYTPNYGISNYVNNIKYYV